MRYYLKKHWTLNALAAFFMIAVAACNVLTSVAMMQITENVIDFNLSGFFKWMIINGALFLLLLAFDQVSTVFKSKAIRKMNNAIRLDMAATLAQSDYQKYHAQESGEYLSQLTNNLNQIENLAWESFYNCITVVATVTFSMVTLLSLHWSLAVLSLAASAVMLNAPKLFGKKMEALGADCASKQAAGTSKMKDLLSGFDVLRSFGRMKLFLSGMGDASDQVEQPKYRLTCIKNLAQNGVSLISVVVQMATNCLIGFLSIKGIILQGALMGGGNLCGNVANGLANLGRLQLAFSAAKPYFENITVHAKDIPREERLSGAAFSKAISMQNVSFAYGDKQVLSGQSLKFEKGGKYALTGASGCGKSTVLKLLLGWLPDYQGSIRFDEKDARDFTQEQRLQQMSYIEQDVFLFNTTIRNNITLGFDFTDEMLEKAIRGSALDGDLAGMPLGLDTPVGENGSNLSGGQKQRVAIARALIHSRSILLVDEGTSALDQKNADIVEEALLSNPGLTLILVSHHLSDERKKQFTKVYELTPTVAAADGNGKLETTVS